MKKIIKRDKRRLQLLKEQAAIRGLNTPPEITIEIEDLEQKIPKKQDRLQQLKAGHSAPADGEITTKDDATRPATSIRRKKSRLPGILLIVAVGIGLGLVIAGGIGFGVINSGDIVESPPAAAVITPTIVPMAAHGVNIAVAEFTSPGGSPLLQPEDSQRLRDALVAAMEAALNDLSPSQRRGEVRPIDPVSGDNPAAREANVAHLAQTHNATIVLYGQIAPQAGGIYLVYPEFYVTPGEQGFDYGAEIIGPTEFGGRVQFLPPLDAPQVVDINAELKARVEALQAVIQGLANFGEKKDAAAFGAFQEARTVLLDSGFESGLEVIQLLLGAVKLREYRRFSGLELEPDIATDSAKAENALYEAELAFGEGLEVDRNYARLNLGMGGIALAQAGRMITETNPWPATLLSRLAEARNWYSKALPAHDEQSPHGYVPLKAQFGVAQTYFAEYGYYQQQAAQAGDKSTADTKRQLAHRAYQKAETGFKSVVAGYRETGRPPQLAELAGQAQALLGKLALFEAVYLDQSHQPEAAQKLYRETIVACDDAFQILEGDDLKRSRSAVYYRVGCYDWQAVAYARQQPPEPNAADAACTMAMSLSRDSAVQSLEALNCISEIQDDIK